MPIVPSSTDNIMPHMNYLNTHTTLFSVITSGFVDDTNRNSIL